MQEFNSTNITYRDGLSPGMLSLANSANRIDNRDNVIQRFEGIIIELIRNSPISIKGFLE